MQSKVYYGECRDEFGLNFKDVEDPLNADLLLANIALQKGMYDAYQNIRSGDNKPEQTEALQRELDLMHELSDDDQVKAKKFTFSKYVSDYEINKMDETDSQKSLDE